MRKNLWYAACASLALSCSSLPRQSKDDKPPEGDTGRYNKSATFAKRHMVVAANPIAAEAGRQVLRRGGSAIDAAIAVQAVLTLVEPQSSGIGGGALLLYYSAATGKITAFDGRETAPAKIHPNVFLNEDGSVKDFYDVATNGIAVGVPGVLRMLELAHKKNGKLPWADLFSDAINHAERGFRVTPRLHSLLQRDKYLKLNANANSYFYKPDGRAADIGELLVNPSLGDTLRKIASGGASVFYKSEIAKDIIATVRQTARNPGYITEEDLVNYQPKERMPVCINYRIYRVCSFGPPSSGGTTVLEALGILNNFNIEKQSDVSFHLMMEASRLAFADRDRYLADEDFVKVPVSGLLDSHYLKQRAGLIRLDHSLGMAEAGNPPTNVAVNLKTGISPEQPSTSHMAIVDDDGNVVSMTTSVEDAFGSRMFVRGFLLNNQLTDFSFLPNIDGAQVANRIEPGKRPRSSMTPIIVLDPQGRFHLAVGSAGGARIIGYVLKTLIAVLDWKFDIQAAIGLPNMLNRNGDTELEIDQPLEPLKGLLQARGHKVRFLELNSGLHGIVHQVDGYRGGADPRREGVALAD